MPVKENDPATMERMDWQASVRKGATLAKTISRSSWALGDLALKLFPVGENTTRAVEMEIGGTVRTLSDFADAIDMSPKVLANMRSVSSAWPPSQRRPNVAWATHRALSAHPDRFNLIREGMKRSDATSIVESLRQSNTPASSPTVCAERAVMEARAALAIAADKRRKFEPEVRTAMLDHAAELREIADRIESALSVVEVAPAMTKRTATKRRRFMARTPSLSS